MLQVAQTAVDDPGRTAGSAAGKVVLFDEQHALSASGALARNRGSVDAAANNDNFETFAFQARPGCAAHQHSHSMRLNAVAIEVYGPKALD